MCQILFHCDAARNLLRNGMEGIVLEDLHAGIGSAETAALAHELQNLARNLADGFTNGLSDERYHLDIHSPHELLDKFLRCHPLALGEQHDAREALEEILTQTRLGDIWPIIKYFWNFH